ncbi:MAG TPA: trigger factor [Verrucomicrobiae bacterium]|nr:trigger factor [Verrucomicrobiae bacterium]
MNVETLAPCKRLLRFEIDVKSVEEAFEATARDFIKHARLPGFRPGKAPKEMVFKQFEKDIAEDVKRKLISDAYRQGIKDQNLDVLGYPDIEEIHFERGQALQFAATVEIKPEFELPEYRGLPARRETGGVTDEDVAKAIEILRDQASKFNKVDREAREGDIVVVNYSGTCEGKPLAELAPTAKSLGEQKGFWIEVKPTSFIPGFAMQLVGSKAGDHRKVTVDFPQESVSAPLAGKKGDYEVEVVEVKEKALPALDEAFAKSLGADGVEALRDGVRRDLQNEFNQRQKRNIRSQIAAALLSRVDFGLPESLLAEETRQQVYQLVEDNQRRGVPKEAIEAQKEQVYALAQNIARDRIKTGFILRRIADREGIRAEQHEVTARIAVLAQASDMAPQKYAQELEKNGRVGEVYHLIITEKVMNFLHENARIEDVPREKGAHLGSTTAVEVAPET